MSEVTDARRVANEYETRVGYVLNARLPAHTADCDEAWTSGRCLRCDVMAGISVAFGFARPLPSVEEVRAYVDGASW